MKKVLNFGSLLLILGLVVGGCGKDPQIEQGVGLSEKGNFSLLLDKMGSFDEVTRAAGATKAVDVQDFSVRIFGTTLRETSYDSTWLRYGDMGEIISLPAGSYTIEAFNGEQKSGFDMPYYYGKKEFSVGIQELTQTQVVCQLACVKVTVDFSALFKDNVEGGVCLVSSVDGVTLEFSEEQMGDGYIAVPSDSELRISVRGTYREDNSALERTYFIPEVAARQWHKITLNVSTVAGIESDGMILVDHRVDEKPTEIVVPGLGDVIDNNGDSGSWNDEPIVTPDPGEDKQNAPLVTGVGFDIDQVLTKTKNDDALNVEIKTIVGSIDSLVVEIESPALSPEALQTVGLRQRFDIANVEASLESALEELGLIKSDDPIKGKTMHTFAIGQFLPMLGMLPNGVDNFHKFHLRVVDTEKNVTNKTLTINLTE